MSLNYGELIQTYSSELLFLLLPQAMSTQEANRAASNKMPPLWAAAAIVLLGWNEFLAVLYNPLWLLIGIVLFLFGKVLIPQTACSFVEAARGSFHSCRRWVGKEGMLRQRGLPLCDGTARQVVRKSYYVLNMAQ